ncbi:MAG: 2-C-methyl-D-erythritol 4-phosphate cytidylyltransferase [Proteobacteria bacterium]|nr:2-C-methyl-D-erythritol 4-phosphate cytidylyltransferase [Pseudomonadota bacterium]
MTVTDPTSASHFALVPAAGSGARMGGDASGGIPKQYLPLAGHPLIFHALATLCSLARIKRVFVVLAPEDDEWSRHDWSALGSKLLPLFCGGTTRAESVRNGLRATAAQVSAQDWMLVHDAARPCLAPWHVDTLIDAIADDEVGGILAVPVADTLKRADASKRIDATVSRSALWQAQTPQMFRHAYLRRALESHANLEGVTDEAGAMEALGFRPKLVAGDATNLKVTYPLDLLLAGWILRHRNEEEDA